MKRIVYYRLRLTLESPLAIGSGTGASTDKDVIVDKYGVPFIPGTSIAGVLRSCFDEDDRKLLFGDVRINTGTDDGAFRDDAVESRLKVYDALPDESAGKTSRYGRYYITQRDCVALKDKVSVEGAKFDFEAVETGAAFVGFLEMTADSDAERKIEAALARFQTGELRLGGKTSRGYGRVSLTAQKKTFDLSSPTQPGGSEGNGLTEWLDFDMFDAAAWKGVTPLALSEERKQSHIVIQLKNKAGISIREYSTDVSTEEETMPDYRHLSLHDRDNTPVIPGSCWAGAFRERFAAFTDNAAVRDFFGYVEQQKQEDGAEPIARKSRILFSESRLSGGEWKVLTRNSIDRFSSATKDGNLYTEKTYYGGTTELDIMADSELLKKYIVPFSCVLKDLHFGFLAVGGLTAVGRGLFAIGSITVNGIDVTGTITSPDGVLTEKDIVCEARGEENHAE